jgi:hypothetical protein
VDYFKSSNKAQVSKSAACAKFLVSRNSLYYKPKTKGARLLFQKSSLAPF